MAGAFEVSSLSTPAQAFLRASGSVIFAAASIEALTCGSSRTAQFELLIGTIALPLNGTYRYAKASVKSGIQPAVGQTWMWAFTLPQNLEYIVCCGTGFSWVL